jgi:hypothetical protein
MGSDDAIADLERGHAAPDLDHVADDLVAEDERDPRGSHDLRDVRSAETAAAYAQQKLTGADGRARPRFHAKPATP